LLLAPLTSVALAGAVVSAGFLFKALSLPPPV
jgi:hypothetical protein